MKKTYFTNLPISQMFGVPKTSETKKLPTLGAPKNWCVRSFRCRPALATLSASFSAFTWCTFREFFVRSFPWGGREPTEDKKSGGHSMTPTETTNSLFRKSLQKLCGSCGHEVFDFCKMGICFFGSKWKWKESNHLRTLRQKWASSSSLISLLSVKILPWQKNTYR